MSRNAAARKQSDESRDALALRQLEEHRANRAPQPRLGQVQVAHVDIAALRAKLGMTQKEFSEAFGFSPRTLQNWEQRRRFPDKSARILLRVIERHPEEVADIARALG